MKMSKQTTNAIKTILLMIEDDDLRNNIKKKFGMMKIKLNPYDLSEVFIREHQGKVNWKSISRYQQRPKKTKV